jgi:transposase
VVAPSLIPTKSGDWVKTNRRDATMLARLHRAGELTPVWVPDADHEAMRDLIRLRSVVRHIVTRGVNIFKVFLLRHGRKHGRGTAWRMAYRRWLSTLAFEHPAQQIAFQDYVDAVTDAEGRLKRVEEQIFGLLPDWNLCPVVDALQAMGDRPDQCRGVGHGSRRLHALFKPTPAHGLFWPGPGAHIT